MYFFELFFNLRLTAVNTCEKQYKKIKKSRIFADKKSEKNCCLKHFFSGMSGHR